MKSLVSRVRERTVTLKSVSMWSLCARSLAGVSRCVRTEAFRIPLRRQASRCGSSGGCLAAAALLVACSDQTAAEPRQTELEQLEMFTNRFAMRRH